MELCRTYGALEWGGASFGDRVTPCPVLCRAYSTLIRNIEIHYSLFTIHYSLSSPPPLSRKNCEIILQVQELLLFLQSHNNNL